MPDATTEDGVRLGNPCKDCEWKGTYELGGQCSNCGLKYILVIPRSHRRPHNWRCPHCDCNTVGAV